MRNYPDQLAILYHERMEGATNAIYPDEYRQIMDKSIDLYKEIKAALPEDKIHLVSDLDSACATLASIYEKTGYRLGFSDAFILSGTAFNGRA